MKFKISRSRFLNRGATVALASLCAIITLGQPLGAEETLKGKKLIEFGWDEPNTQFMRQNVAKMEQLPFDGLVFHADSVKGGNFDFEMWGKRRFELAEFEGAIEDLKATPFRRITDLFLRANVRPGDVDWFDDAAWATVLHNSTVAADVAKQGRCKGLLFDIEQYEGQLFCYQKQAHRGTKTFAEYRTIVRRRGQEWIKAVNSKFPGAVIFLTYGYSIAGANPKDRSGETYGLLADFLDGMFDGCSPQTRIVDGWENAYAYKQKKQFADAYEMIKSKLAAQSLSAEKYRNHIEAAFGIWMDFDWPHRGWDTANFSKNYLSPAEFEEVVRSALLVSDRYVWIYTEKPLWWTGERVPKPYLDALTKAHEQPPVKPSVR